MKHANITKWVVMAVMLGAAVAVTIYFHRVLGSAAVFTHLFYIPIILAALWWGYPGICVALALVVLLITSHVIHISDAAGLDDYLRAIMFLVVAWTVVLLRGRIISANHALKQKTSELETRVRALSCLYSLNDLRDDPNLYVEDIFIQTEALIKTALANESEAQVSIYRHDQVTGDEHSVPYNLTLTAPIIAGDRTTSGIKVSWPATAHPEGAVVKNTLELMDAIAKRLGKIIEHERARTELERYRLHLEDLVQDRTEELIAVNRRLRSEVDERQKAVLSLRESEKQYRTLFENAEDAIFIAQDNHIRFPNPAIVTMTGHTMDHLLKTPFAELVHPDDRKMVIERHQKRIDGDEAPASYSFRVVTADGTIRWVEINTVAIQWQGQTATLNFLRDITTRRKLENTLSQIQRMEALGLLAGGIAHQFNNALSGITGNIDLLRLTLPDNVNVQRYGDAMLQSVQTMSGLTQKLLAYARGGKYQSQKYSLVIMVKDVLVHLTDIGEKMVRFETAFSPDTPMVEADPVQMRMVLLAILRNAVEAINDKGLVRIETFRAKLDSVAAEAFTGLPPGDYAILSIVDNGKGMAEEIRQRVFEPFFTTKFLGRGMGMAAAYGIVKNHGGYIYLDSEPNHGTVVHILLPQCS